MLVLGAGQAAAAAEGRGALPAQTNTASVSEVHVLQKSDANAETRLMLIAEGTPGVVDAPQEAVRPVLLNYLLLCAIAVMSFTVAVSLYIHRRGEACEQEASKWIAPVPSALGFARKPSAKPMLGALQSGEQHIIVLPLIRSASMRPNASTDFEVFSGDHVKVAHVNLFRPQCGNAGGGDAQQAVEYLALDAPDGQEEVAVLAVMPGPGGMGWLGHVYQGGNTHCACLQRVLGQPEETFELVRAGILGGKLLRIEGDASAPTLRVLSQGKLLASVAAIGGAAGECRVVCSAECDVGLVLVSLLGVERLRVHYAAT